MTVPIKMPVNIDALLAKIEKDGIANDSLVKDRSLKQLNITKDTGEFLAVLVKSSKSKRLCEVGTSNGYSTLWLANALPEDGKITTLDVQQHKIDQASEHFHLSGLASKIEVLKLDACDYFTERTEEFDFIFLDAERTEYMKFAEQVVRTLAIGGLLVCDNAISHKEEMADFIHFIQQSNQFLTSLVPVGKGEFVACKIA